MAEKKFGDPNRNSTIQQPTTSAPAPQEVRYIDLFQDQPYANDEALKQIVQNYQNRASEFGQVEQNRQATFDQVSGYADVFKNQFKNYVGRDPNQSEYNQFFKSLSNDAPWAQEAGAFAIKQREQTKGLLQDQFARTAAEEAELKSRRQAESAVAPNSAFDAWQKSYRGAVSDTEKSLMDYQTRLFEKLRPQLLTSLQSQGLLNTGALNEAFAGAAGDLASESSNFVAGAKSAAEQDIANRRYDIQSSPTNFALQNTFNTVPNLTAAGQTALGNVFNSYLQDQSFNQQMKLADLQRQEKPSLLSQYGGLLLGGAVGGFASGLGQRGFLGARPGMG